MRSTYFFVWTYLVGDLGTFAFLIWEEVGDVHGLLNWVIWLTSCGVRATVWPAYWTVVRWIF